MRSQTDSSSYSATYRPQAVAVRRVTSSVWCQGPSLQDGHNDSFLWGSCGVRGDCLALHKCSANESCCSRYHFYGARDMPPAFSIEFQTYQKSARTVQRIRIDLSPRFPKYEYFATVTFSFPPLYIYVYMYEYMRACEVTSVVSDSLRPHGLSPPGSCVYGILQARIWEWVAMPSSKESSWPRDWTQVSSPFSTLAGGFFTTSTTWEAHTHTRKWKC